MACRFLGVTEIICDDNLSLEARKNQFCFSWFSFSFLFCLFVDHLTVQRGLSDHFLTDQ